MDIGEIEREILKVCAEEPRLIGEIYESTNLEIKQLKSILDKLKLHCYLNESDHIWTITEDGKKLLKGYDRWKLD